MKEYDKLLTFLMRDSREPLMQLLINTQTKASKLLFVTDDEITMHPLFLPKERNYNGVEKRLQWWFNVTDTLPEMLEQFKVHGFLFDGQYSLDLEITDLDENTSTKEIVVVMEEPLHPFPAKTKQSSVVYPYIIAERDEYGNGTITLSNEDDTREYDSDKTNKSKNRVVGKTAGNDFYNIRITDNLIPEELGRLVKSLHQNGFVGDFVKKEKGCIVYEFPLNRNTL